MPRVTWKDEDEVDGEPVGPVRIWTDEEMEQAENGILGVPYDPNRPVEKWVTQAEAQKIADEHDADLEVG